MANSALICIDYINDIISEGGKLAGKGYKSFADSHGTLGAVASLQAYCRERAIPVVHVRVGFDPQYLNHPKNSPLFAAAAQFNALASGSHGTEFAASVRPAAGELVMHKPRVSAFYGTPMDSALRCLGVEQLMICGVATDLAVQSAARDAHDRDFSVVVVADACAAANDVDHETSLATLAKIASITTLDLLRKEDEGS